MLLCNNDSYYTGYTTDVERRFKEHQSGNGAKYTRSFRPLRIVYTKAFETRSEAMKHEAALKKLKHHQKKAWIFANSCMNVRNSGILKVTDGITQ
jgi:putative endonuclease